MMKKSEKTRQGLYNVGFIGGVRTCEIHSATPESPLQRSASIIGFRRYADA
jgi:hypothetical protein